MHEFNEVWPTLFVTDKRIIARTGGFGKETLWEVGREHVSGASSFRNRRVGVMAAGAIITGIGLFLLLYISVLTGALTVVTGIIIIVAGALTGPKGLTIQGDGGQSLTFKVQGWETVPGVIKVLREV